MVWPFAVEYCLLCARELDRAVIRTPCCRVLVHKAWLYAALAISPSRPTPTCPHCQQELGLARFRRLCLRLSGKWSPWFECPLAPVSPSRSFLPWGLITEHGSTAAAAIVFRRSSRRRSGKWNPSVEVSRAPDTPYSFFLCSFHLGASTTTTTTTSTIVTTPRRQATTGKCWFHVTQGNRLCLGRDVNLSPPGLVEDKPGQVSPSPVLSRLNGMSCVMETLCSKGSDTSFLSVSLC